ncbi:MAG: dephospho-CoA kinase [Thermodesulfovibrionales bacterium]|nr:dephospho-CoA kinase [Thermodesulfovibrionales bacterium]
MLVIALTGNYGMGKSFVLALFQQLGAVVLDADEIVRSLLSGREAVGKIRALLGETVFSENGRVNRDRLAELVFRNDSLRRSLEDILHPQVFERIDSFLAAHGKKGMVVIVEVPLLFERGYENRFDRTITVFTDDETALRRLEAKGIEREKASLRLKTQLPIEEKKRRADFLIDNRGTPQETEAQVKPLYKKLREEANDGNHKRTRKSQ